MKSDKKKKISAVLPFVIVFYVLDKCSWLFRQMDSSVQLAYRITGMFGNLSYAFKNPLPSFHPIDIGVGAASACALYLYLKGKRMNRKNFRQGVEYGSAKWGTHEDIRPFMSQDPENNMIFTMTEGLMIIGRPIDPRFDRNKNVLIIGGSGSGKTRFFVKPNLMQMQCSYIVTDPKGTLILECGKMFARGCPVRVQKKDRNGKPMSDVNGTPVYKKDRNGNFIYKKDKHGRTVYEKYQIKVLNTINFKESMRYNPFHYIKSEKDLLSFVTAFIANTNAPGAKSGDGFWENAEKLLYEAYIAYILAEAPEEEMNFKTLLAMIEASTVKEDDEDYKNAIDLMFDELKEKLSLESEEYIMSINDPAEREMAEREYKFGKYAISMYGHYKNAAGKTAKSILISCSARLAPLNIEELQDLTAYDELELEKLGDRKTVFFVIISDTDSTFNFLVSIMYSQMFNILCDRALEYGGRLPVHVRCLLDEFSNIGIIPGFDKKIATIRSRGISACIILQTRSQLNAIYDKNADTIVGNGDSKLFLGGNEQTTLSSLSEELGKETIDFISTSNTKGQSESNGTNFQKTGRNLMDKNELALMDRGECILQINGVKPFKSRKYDITKHKRYKLLLDYSKKNYFDFVAYREHKPKKKKLNEAGEVYVKTVSLKRE